MARNNLNYYRSCCDWAVDSGLIVNNPFSSLVIPRPKKKSTDADDYRAFTLEQRDIIIESFENHSTYSYYAPLVKFMFWTGCRTGEAFALTWGDISPDCCHVFINKSRNLHGILKGTKNGKKRIFPTFPNSKLQKLLLEIRPESPDQDEVIFLSKLGSKMTSYALNDIWKGTAATYKEKNILTWGWLVNWWHYENYHIISNHTPPGIHLLHGLLVAGLALIKLQCRLVTTLRQFYITTHIQMWLMLIVQIFNYATQMLLKLKENRYLQNWD